MDAVLPDPGGGYTSTDPGGGADVKGEMLGAEVKGKILEKRNKTGRPTLNAAVVIALPPNMHQRLP